jgi:hypothetical protein
MRSDRVGWILVYVLGLGACVVFGAVIAWLWMNR